MVFANADPAFHGEEQVKKGMADSIHSMYGAAYGRTKSDLTE